MAIASNDYPQLTVQEVCTKMGLSPVSGSYERALCNYLGIFSATVNGSWIQTLYPTLVTIYNDLKNQTYSGLTIDQYKDDPQGIDYNAPYNVPGMYAYAYNPLILTYPNYTSMGLYTFILYPGDPIYGEYYFVPTHIISWLSPEFMLFVQISAADDLQTQQISTNSAADASLATTVAGHTSQIATLNTQIPAAPSYNNAPGRSLNSSVQISTTKRTRVSYTISLTTALSLLNASAAGQVFLEISANNSTWTTINSAGISRSLSIVIAVGLNETAYYNVQGEVPTGYYVRLRTVTSGGATMAFVSGQEVQY